MVLIHFWVDILKLVFIDSSGKYNPANSGFRTQFFLLGFLLALTLPRYYYSVFSALSREIVAFRSGILQVVLEIEVASIVLDITYIYNCKIIREILEEHEKYSIFSSVKS